MEATSRHDLTAVDSDVKHQFKQTNKQTELSLPCHIGVLLGNSDSAQETMHGACKCPCILACF